MGKDSHSKQSKGSNNAKLPSFIAQDSKANNLFYHHHSVLQWFPEPWSFMHLDIVHAMLVILSEVLLFFQYFVLFGSSFLNCNWRQYVVSSLLLVTEAIYVITPKVIIVLLIVIASTLTCISLGIFFTARNRNMETLELDRNFFAQESDAALFLSSTFYVML